MAETPKTPEKKLFEVTSKIIKLRGLDRHQTFPFVGQAMPGRVQRRDAYILRKHASAAAATEATGPCRRPG